MYSEGGAALTQKLANLFTIIWQLESIPQDLKDADIIHLFKGKGDRQLCDNHRGVSLLSIAGKILARIMLNCLVAYLEIGLLPESQCDFHKGHRTIYMILAVRRL